MFKSYKFWVLFLTALTLVIYLLTSVGKTPYDYFTRLAGAFLQGKYYLSENPPWLSELIPVTNQRFYVPYPPMPAILSLPFVYLFKNQFEQQWLAHLLGAGVVAIISTLAWRLRKDLKLVIWTGLLVAFGNIIWFLASQGSSWYLGQLSAAFFLSAILLELVGKKRAFLVGLFLGGAFLSRLHTVLIFPLILYYLFEKKTWFKKYLSLVLGFLPFAFFNFGYNWLRFGVIWDKGYLLIPGLLKEPWFQDGLFNLNYLPNGLRVMFTSLPKWQKNFPYLFPSWGGLAIWITTPAFIYAFWASLKEKAVLLSWFSAILIALVVLAHGSTGFSQFGYRFAVDFYPLLFFLILNGVKKAGLSWHHWLLLTLSIVVNLWGVLWINKFGWVSF